MSRVRHYTQLPLDEDGNLQPADIRHPIGTENCGLTVSDLQVRETMLKIIIPHQLIILESMLTQRYTERASQVPKGYAGSDRIICSKSQVV